MRISDTDRHAVAEVLREAAGEGRIDMSELDERLEAAYAAKTYADLVPITADLPVTPAAAQIVPRATRSVTPSERSFGSTWVVMGESKRQGAWLVPAEHTAFALMGEVVLDLREATFAAAETVITANAIMAEVKVIVDAYTRVEVDGIPVLGEFSHKDVIAAELSTDSPRVRLRGVALMGSVTVVRHPPAGTPKKYFGTY